MAATTSAAAAATNAAAATTRTPFRVRVETDQVARLRAVLESARDFAREATMRFSAAGVTLAGIDNGHIVLVVFEMTAATLAHAGGSIVAEGGNKASALASASGTSATCAEEAVDVGVDTRMLASCLRGSARAESVALEVRSDRPNAIEVECRSCGGASVMQWTVTAPTPDTEAIRQNAGLMRVHYAGSVTMSSVTFQEVVRNVASCDVETIDIACDGTTLHFGGKGQLTSARYAMKPTAVIGDARDAPWPIRQTFMLSYVSRIAKAKSVGRQVQIFLSADDAAACIAYESPIGVLRFIIAPTRDDEAAAAGKMLPSPPVPPPASHAPALPPPPPDDDGDADDKEEAASTVPTAAAAVPVPPVAAVENKCSAPRKRVSSGKTGGTVAPRKKRSKTATTADGEDSGRKGAEGGIASAGLAAAKKHKKKAKTVATTPAVTTAINPPATL
jgi:hypothetical protein